MFFLFTGRLGSVIATFEMTVAYDLSPKVLVEKSNELAAKLQGCLILETSGKQIY